jgi:hypothetical protein
MTATWASIKKDYEAKFEPIASYMNNSLGKDLDALRQGLSLYVQSGGISTDPSSNATYTSVLDRSNTINNHKNSLLTLNKDLANQLANYSKTADMDTLLIENGTLQADIKRLEVEAEKVTNDEKAAELRDQILRSRDTAITKHQLFLLGRPLRPSFIPFLWALSVLFIGTGILLYTYFFPIPPELWPMTLASIYTTLGSPWVWGSLFGAAAIVIFFLVLKIVGYFK